MNGLPVLLNSLPPGQFVTDDFPVLTAGPTEFVDTSEWELTVTDGIVTRPRTTVNVSRSDLPSRSTVTSTPDAPLQLRSTFWRPLTLYPLAPSVMLTTVPGVVRSWSPLPPRRASSRSW